MESDTTTDEINRESIAEDNNNDEIENGPSGNPYVSTDLTKIYHHEDDQFSLRLGRRDGEMLMADFSEDQLILLKNLIERSVEADT